MTRTNRITAALFALCISFTLFSGCGKKDPAASPQDEEAARLEAQRQMLETVFSEEIRSLPESELAALGAKNALPTEMIVPNALSLRVIQPGRFMSFSQADKVIRFFGNTPTLVPFWNQFDQLDLIITSTKVAPVSLLDPKSGEQIGENYPFPITAVYAKKKEPVAKETFISTQFSGVPQDRVQEQEIGGVNVTLAENSLMIPLDASGKNAARIDGLATAVRFPSDSEALVVTGPRQAVERFFTAGEGDQRGVLAQEAGRLDTGSFDFAFLYDYRSPQKEAVTLPVPPNLAGAFLENADSLRFLVDASAPEGSDALRLDVTANSPENLEKISNALGDTLLRLGESLGETPALPEGEDARQGMMQYLPKLKDALSSITCETGENRISAVMKLAPERVELFGNLVDEANRLADLSAKNGKRNATARNLKLLGEVANAYYVKNNAFPPLAVTDENGTPLLSWRVALLPFMGPEGEALYKEFKLDQPWDSTENLKLLDRMPVIYASPLLTESGGKTLFRIFGGEGVPFQLSGSVKMQDLENPGKTFMIVTVDPSQAVEWTKPEALEFNPEKFAEIFGDFVLAVPVMGEVFSASFTGSDDDAKALAGWITGKEEKTDSAGEEEEPEQPNPDQNESPF